MNLLSNIKILTEKVYFIKSSHSLEDLINAVNSVLEVLTDVDRYLTESSLLKWRAKKRNGKNVKEKESQGYTCNNSQQISVETFIL